MDLKSEPPDPKGPSNSQPPILACSKGGGLPDPELEGRDSFLGAGGEGINIAMELMGRENERRMEGDSREGCR